jgi:hypothetical protein
VSGAIGAIITRLAWIGLAFGILYAIYKVGGFSIEALDKTAKAVDNPGGKILILAAFSLLFFGAAVGMVYHVLAMIEAKTLTSDNSIATMALQFIIGSAFSTSFGALIQQIGGSSKNG